MVNECAACRLGAAAGGEARKSDGPRSARARGGAAGEVVAVEELGRPAWEALRLAGAARAGAGRRRRPAGRRSSAWRSGASCAVYVTPHRSSPPRSPWPRGALALPRWRSGTGCWSSKTTTTTSFYEAARAPLASAMTQAWWRRSTRSRIARPGLQLGVVALRWLRGWCGCAGDGQQGDHRWATVASCSRKASCSGTCARCGGVPDRRDFRFAQARGEARRRAQLEGAVGRHLSVGEVKNPSTCGVGGLVRGVSVHPGPLHLRAAGGLLRLCSRGSTRPSWGARWTCSSGL